jgi:hypothetical protein
MFSRSITSTLVLANMANHAFGSPLTLLRSRQDGGECDYSIDGSTESQLAVWQDAGVGEWLDLGSVDNGEDEWVRNLDVAITGNDQSNRYCDSYEIPNCPSVSTCGKISDVPPNEKRS